jgi:transcriptional regulator with XRE-family HTH domain
MKSGFIAKRQEELGIEDKELADACGISESYLGNIKRGLTPGKPVLLHLARKLQTSVEALTGEAESTAKAATG